MDLFKNSNFDFLGKKWPFIIGSLVMITAGLVSLVIHDGPRYGIDFKGGVLMYLKFKQMPSLDQLRSALTAKIPGEILVQQIYGANEVMVNTELNTQNEEDLANARQLMVQTLAAHFGVSPAKPDFNNIGQQAIADALRDPLFRKGVGLSDEDVNALAGRLREFRDTPPQSGLITNFDQLKGVEGVTPQVLATLRDVFQLAPYAIRNTDVVGPKVGAELRQQAVMATLLALGGMLVYVAFRFEWIYGVAAVLAVFHDTIITIGLFSIFDKEISLTVVAALLTLVGYSMNDTIVVFDRIRENLKITRRTAFPELVNLSINQTLSRTVLTSGLTFTAVLALLLFGGQVLNGFAFALTVGIIVGTYSSIFIASPILIFWQGMLERRKKARVVPAPARGTTPKRGSAKAVK